MSGALEHDLVPIVSLAGVILVGLGALYLAYDLLGGKNGPLRTFTKSASYGLLFGSAYGLPLGVWFGLAGVFFSGPALSIEIGRRNVRDIHPFFEALALGLLRTVSFGAAGWLSKDSWFGINFGIFCAVGFVAAYVIVGPPAHIGLGPRIDKAVLERAALRAASIGLAAVLSGAIHRENRALSYGVEVGGVTGMSSGILVAIAPSVEAWVDNLPDRRLGTCGAILIVIGSLLQTPQYVFPLVGLSL
jgi:tetrahydromethanopterin S-methyltransferase subunit F